MVLNFLQRAQNFLNKQKQRIHKKLGTLIYTIVTIGSAAIRH